jgi:RNA polymerase sigma-70 factor (ECF subfamily)
MEKEILHSDDELMLRVKKGDMTAFETLYDRYNKRLFHYILRFVGERSLAEDILQETFLRILQKRKNYRKTGHFSTYLFTVGRNLTLDTLKTWEKRHVLSGQDDYMNKAMDLSEKPSEALEKAELSRAVQREIETLPRDQQELLILSKYSGLSYEEIAKIVSSTPAAVKQKVYRAMLALRQKLKTMDE